MGKPTHAERGTSPSRQRSGPSERRAPPPSTGRPSPSSRPPPAPYADGRTRGKWPSDADSGFRHCSSTTPLTGEPVRGVVKSLRGLPALSGMHCERCRRLIHSVAPRPNEDRDAWRRGILRARSCLLWRVGRCRHQLRRAPQYGPSQLSSWVSRTMDGGVAASARAAGGAATRQSPPRDGADTHTAYSSRYGVSPRSAAH